MPVLGSKNGNKRKLELEGEPAAKRAKVDLQPEPEFLKDISVNNQVPIKEIQDRFMAKILERQEKMKEDKKSIGEKYDLELAELQTKMEEVKEKKKVDLKQEAKVFRAEKKMLLKSQEKELQEIKTKQLLALKELGESFGICSALKCSKTLEVERVAKCENDTHCQEKEAVIFCEDCNGLLECFECNTKSCKKCAEEWTYCGLCEKRSCSKKCGNFDSTCRECGNTGCGGCVPKCPCDGGGDADTNLCESCASDLQICDCGFCRVCSDNYCCKDHYCYATCGCHGPNCSFKHCRCDIR